MKRSHLTMGDIIVLALIFFGHAIYSSTVWFLQIQAQPELLQEPVFDNAANWWTIIQELALLTVAGIYLHIRRFDWTRLNMALGRSTIALAALLVVSAGVVADALDWVLYGSLQQYSMAWQPSLLAVALVNGFYEELFFMGLIYAVRDSQLKIALAFSLLVRFAFHTYQGLESALIITSMGVVFMWYRAKIQYLVPFFLAHAVFDVFGLSLSGIFFGLKNVFINIFV